MQHETTWLTVQFGSSFNWKVYWWPENVYKLNMNTLYYSFLAFDEKTPPSTALGLDWAYISKFLNF